MLDKSVNNKEDARWDKLKTWNTIGTKPTNGKLKNKLWNAHIAVCNIHQPIHS